MRRLFIATAAFVVLLASPHAAGTRFVTETDLFKFTWIADPQISPDGSTVVFVRVTVNEKENRYESSLFAVPASGAENPRRLTSGIRDTSPRWAPDGKRIAFVRAIEKDKQVQPAQIDVMAMDGGEARPLTELTSGAGTPVWSPDGTMIAFSSPTPEEKKPAQGEHQSDVKVITRAVYRSNGNPTYVESEKHSHIFTLAVSDTSDTSIAKPAPKQITDGGFDEQNITWSRDSSQIYFTSTRVPESYYEADDSDLFSVPAAGGSIAKVATIDGSIGHLSVSPDGKRIAFVGTLHGNPVRSYSQPDLWVTDATRGSTPKNLTASYDFDVSSGIGGDQSAPRGQNATPIVWSRDSASLIVVVAEHGNANLKRVTIATGAIEPVTDGTQAVAAYSATPDGSTIAAAISTQTNICDIFVVDPGDAGRSAGLSGNAVRKFSVHVITRV